MRRYVGLDLSTKTGFVALDKRGNVLRDKELIGMGKEDPKRMVTLIDEIIDHIQPDDFICIEGFGFASQQAVMNGGIGWGVRMALHRRGIKYYEVAPMSLKRFCDASKKRLNAEGKEMKAKDVVAAGVYEHWGYEHSSDNVIDAYVLAEIARCIEMGTFQLKPYQEDVINTILTPAAEKKKEKAAAAKKKKERDAKKAADIAAGIIKPKTKRKPPEQPTLAF